MQFLVCVFLYRKYLDVYRRFKTNHHCCCYYLLALGGRENLAGQFVCFMGLSWALAIRKSEIPILVAISLILVDASAIKMGREFLRIATFFLSKIFTFLLNYCCNSNSQLSSKCMERFKMTLWRYKCPIKHRFTWSCWAQKIFAKQVILLPANFAVSFLWYVAGFLLSRVISINTWYLFICF